MADGYITSFYGHNGCVNDVCSVSVDGRTLIASVADDERVRLWDPITGKKTRTFKGHSHSIQAICVVRAHGRDLLASGGHDNTVRLWDPSTGEHANTLKGHRESILALCTVELDGRSVLVSAGRDRHIWLWDVDTGQAVRQLRGHRGFVNDLCSTEIAGKPLIVSAGMDKTIRLWDPATGRQVMILKGHRDDVNSVCSLEVEGASLLASASDDETVRLWDRQTGRQTRTLGHTYWVHSVCAVEAEGRTLLATAGDKKRIRIWDPATGLQTTSLKGHADAVNCLATADVAGREVLVSGSDDDVALVWDLPHNQVAVEPARGQPEVDQSSIERLIRLTPVEDLDDSAIAALSRDLEPLLGRVETLLQNGTFENDSLIEEQVEFDRRIVRTELLETSNSSARTAIIVPTVHRLITNVSPSLLSIDDAQDSLFTNVEASLQRRDPAPTLDVLQEIADRIDLEDLALRLDVGHSIPEAEGSSSRWLVDQMGWGVGVTGSVMTVLAALSVTGGPALVLGAALGLVATRWRNSAPNLY